jgi:N6-adenosine-specific RNA methylase IME4/ParB-like chromosome segregation protein Spo0J
MDESIKQIPLTKLHPHSKNPRIAIRQDVVDAIAANLEGGFRPCYALTVRQVDDAYQIISGHHRKAAAEKAGLYDVPCWVLDMDDDEAYMALVTSNAQGELSPLEEGLHFNGGGLGVREYARMTGQNAGGVTQKSQAAKVFSQLNTRQDMRSKTQHLAAIHGLPQDVWAVAVEKMLSGGWSAKETAERVAEASKGQTVKRVAALISGQTTIRELARIDETFDRVLSSFTLDATKDQWKAWFASSDPVDIKEVQAMRITLENQEAETLEASENAKRGELPDLVLADPPWRYDFAETDNRQIENQYPSATVEEICAMIPKTEKNAVLFLWATVAKLREAFEVMDAWGFEYKTNAVWDKQKIGMGYWFRGQHELLLVGTKGSYSPPEQAMRVSSVFREARGKHSEKPECVYKFIESAFPVAVKLEMFSRKQRDGWIAFGNEAK